jgi:acyl carrier protein
MSDIAEQVKKLISEHLNVDESKIKPESYFINDLGADEYDVVELVMAYEEKFNIEIPDKEAEELYTVQDAINIVSSKHEV